MRDCSPEATGLQVQLAATTDVQPCRNEGCIVTTIDDIADLIRAAQLKSVRLVEANLKTRVRSREELGKKVNCSLTTATRVEQPQKSVFYVVATINTEMISAGGKEPIPALFVTAGFELEYLLPENFVATSEQLKTFAATNAVFNAWPYWREFIQNTTARMNLPPVTLPLFRLVGKPTEKGPTTIPKRAAKKVKKKARTT